VQIRDAQSHFFGSVKEDCFWSRRTVWIVPGPNQDLVPHTFEQSLVELIATGYATDARKH
jgi:hypothetical protein